MTERDRDPADGLTVRGGAAGTVAQLDDLDALAARLATAAAELAGLAAAVVAVGTDPLLLGSYSLCPVTGVPAELAVVRAVAGPHALAPCAASVAGLALQVAAAARVYRSRDTLTALALHQLSLTLGATTRWAVIPFGAGVVATGNGERLLGLLGALPGAGDATMAVLPGVLGLSDAPAVATALGLLGLATPLLRESGRVSTRVGSPRAGAAPSGVADLLARTSTLSMDRGAAPGSVRVERVVDAAGRRSWIVQIPGTQDWAPRTGGNPLDLTSAVTTLSGRRGASGAVVLQALRRCGAKPGEPVLLVGHSLGGMTAAELAADPRLRRDVTITHVVTAGSPIAASGLPDDVQVLALERHQDPTPWLDGAPNPDRAGWVTVGAPAPGGLQGSHDLAGYLDTATAVDSSRDPGLVRWRAGLGVFLDRPGAASTSWEVTGERFPAPTDRAGGPG